MKRSSLLFAVLVGLGSTPSAVAQVPRRPPPTRTAPASALESALKAARESDYPKAERELAAIRGADQPAAQLALARVHFEQGRYPEAEAIAGKITGDKRIEAAALRAEILLAIGKVDDTLKLLEPLANEKGNGGRRVRLALSEAYLSVGRRDDAKPLLKQFAAEYNADEVKDDASGLAMVGRAMHLLRKPKDANSAFMDAEQVDKKNVDLLLWRADLFADTYDPGHAEEVLNDALKLAPKRADALVLLARVKLEQTLDFDEAEKLVKQALAVNPKHTGAFAVKVGLALRDMDIKGADDAVAAGFAVNPNGLELWALKAATRFLADDKPGYEQAKREAFARNKAYSQFFAVVGEFAEWEHRYDDIVAMMKEAVQVDPADAKAWAQLGLTQARNGDEDEAIKSLEEAWKYDHFNVRAYNTLEKLYKTWIPKQYETKEHGSFKIRYPKDERALLERYVPRFVAETWGAMKNRYGFAPTVPLQVELYGDRQHFSVRTSGLPNIGIQGVCFGRMIASMSPKSEPFNWGNVVWHEIGHVFAIQLSKNHVPRWFTEGLSELETIVKRPEWQREHDPDLYLALKKNALPSAVDMNRAFTHPSEGLEVTVAYYAASQMLLYTVERFGQGAINKALALWGKGERTADVIQHAFGVPAEQYDKGFREWVGARLSRYRGQFMFDPHAKPLDEAKALAQKNPTSAEAQVGLALSLIQARKLSEAQAAAEAALKIDPQEKTAHFVLSKLAGAKKDLAAKEQHLLAIKQAGGDGYTVQTALADVAEEKKDKAGMKAALLAAHRFDPSQSDPLKGLYDLAKEEKNEPEMLDALRKVAVLEQHDRDVWRLLLQKLVDGKLWDEAARVGAAALYVDVHSGAMHTNYARALAGVGRHDQAVFELESALLCEYPAKEKSKRLATVHALLAREHGALKNAAEAKKAYDEAKRLDPENEDLKAIPAP